MKDFGLFKKLKRVTVWLVCQDGRDNGKKRLKEGSAVNIGRYLMCRTM